MFNMKKYHLEAKTCIKTSSLTVNKSPQQHSTKFEARKGTIMPKLSVFRQQKMQIVGR